MVSKQGMLTVLLVAATAATMAGATQYVVGDAMGWTINFNYNAWAQDKVFYVGDTLVFNYPVGKHNVHKVNGTDFKDCSVPSKLVSTPLTSGSDKITLATPGRKWYLCGVGQGQHCLTGQKLFINVRAALAQPPSSWWWAPAPAPATWATPATSPRTPAWKGTPAATPAWKKVVPAPRKVGKWTAPAHAPSANNKY